MKDKYKYVVDNSKYVKLDYDKIDIFINELGDTKYNHWSKQFNLDLTEDKWILLAFIIESMNFCFWKRPKWSVIYHNERLSGSNALFVSIIKEVENNKGFLDIDYLYNLDYEKFKNIFDGNEVCPHLEERYYNFRETIEYIYNNDFYKELYEIKDNQELLNYIINNFNSFRDESNYKNRIIPFYKRANLLVNDLYYLSKTIKNNIKDVDNLMGCADYGIPRTFRDYGILVYNEELSFLVDNKKLIKHNSTMEIEIRASTLYVIEIIKERLNNKGISINSVALDNVIWIMGKRLNNKSNCHHTITIYY